MERMKLEFVSSSLLDGLSIQGVMLYCDDRPPGAAFTADRVIRVAESMGFSPEELNELRAKTQTMVQTVAELRQLVLAHRLRGDPMTPGFTFAMCTTDHGHYHAPNGGMSSAINSFETGFAFVNHAVWQQLMPLGTAIDLLQQTARSPLPDTV